MADIVLAHPYIGSSANLTLWSTSTCSRLESCPDQGSPPSSRLRCAASDPPRAFLPVAAHARGAHLWNSENAVGSGLLRLLDDESKSPKRQPAVLFGADDPSDIPKHKLWPQARQRLAVATASAATALAQAAAR
eukprot:39638-Hanusia_phi.AAC.1